MTLFRPVGLAELSLIYDLKFKAYPPRLPEQPILYPVLNREYARQIARDWNCILNDSRYAGFVTAFEINGDYVSRYETQVVGGKIHEELWVPAEELKSFNDQIIGPIRVIDSYFGEKFSGCIAGEGYLKSLSLSEQWKMLNELYSDDKPEFEAELERNAKVIQLNGFYWQERKYLNSSDLSRFLTRKLLILPSE